MILNILQNNDCTKILFQCNQFDVLHCQVIDMMHEKALCEQPYVRRKIWIIVKSRNEKTERHQQTQQLQFNKQNPEIQMKFNFKQHLYNLHKSEKIGLRLESIKT